MAPAAVCPVRGLPSRAAVPKRPAPACRPEHRLLAAGGRPGQPDCVEPLADFLHAAGIALLLAACLAGVLSLLFGLPGTAVIALAALVYGWATGFTAVTLGTIGWLVALAVAAEAIEFAAGAFAPGEQRPSRRVATGAIVGSMVGALAGAPLLFGLGALGGALAGAFAGASLAATAEGQSAGQAARAGLAAMRGRLLGFLVKSAIAVVMVLVVVAALLS
ncbi:MAG: DUF456 family protein [Candidatus Dadabacteria bacterium]|nr:MAG: DUF456 family protein [Candidatus Dadabacteria bacterium]